MKFDTRAGWESCWRPGARCGWLQWIRRAHHRQADPAFGQALRQAAQGGVNVQAWRCQVSLTSIQLLDQVPVDL